MGATWYDPIATLGFLAGVTTSVRLLSHVLALPYHHPLEVAKAFATLDRLSGGRAILGVGAGHVEGEFALLGLDFAARGRHVEAALPAIRAALDHEYPALPDGRGLDGSAAVAPRPVQASVPIWVGGSSAVAVRRAARLGDGWLPQGIRPRDLPGVVERIRRLRAEAGRPERFDVGANVGCYVGTPTWDVGRTYLGRARRPRRHAAAVGRGRGQPAPGPVPVPGPGRAGRPDRAVRGGGRPEPRDLAAHAPRSRRIRRQIVRGQCRPPSTRCRCWGWRNESSGGGQAVEAPPPRDQHVGDDVDVPSATARPPPGGRPVADGLALRLVAGRLGQPQRLGGPGLGQADGLGRSASAWPVSRT